MLVVRTLFLAIAVIAIAGCARKPVPVDTTQEANAASRSRPEPVIVSASPRVPRATHGAAAASGAAFGFKAPRQYVQASDDPVGVVIYEVMGSGDFNGDRRSDLVFLAGQDNSIAMLLQSDDGSFEPLLYPNDTSNYQSLHRLALGDFNEDGITDVVFDTRNEYGSMEGVGLLLSRYGQAPEFHEGYAPWAAMSEDVAADWAVMDGDRDGHLDLVLLRNSVNLYYDEMGCEPTDASSTALCPHYEILRGDGHGNFTSAGRVKLGISERIRSATLEDVNRDGLPDLALLLAARHPDPTRTVVFVPGLRAGGFGAPVELFNPVTDDFYVQFGDINGDGLRDAVIGVEIHERNADGTFGEALRLATYMVNPTLPIIADFNGDGLDDLVNHQFIDFYTMPFMAVYMGGGGTLQPPFRAYHPGYNHSFSIPMNRHVYAKGDFNSDGCADLAVAIQYDGVAIFDGYNCKQRVIRTGGNLPPIRVP